MSWISTATWWPRTTTKLIRAEAGKKESINLTSPNRVFTSFAISATTIRKRSRQINYILV